MLVPVWYKRDVSRETLDKLSAYADLIAKWTKSINLIARSTTGEILDRHIWDSAQTYSGEDGSWIDLGSGGGLPGIVVSILAQGEGRKLDTTLVESDQRKCAFLRTCARELDLPMKVAAQRIEDIPKAPHTIVSARALAHLDRLLMFAQPLLADGGTCVFMKGAKWQQEIAEAEQNWRFSYSADPSNTDSMAAILRIRELERV